VKPVPGYTYIFRDHGDRYCVDMSLRVFGMTVRPVHFFFDVTDSRSMIDVKCELEFPLRIPGGVMSSGAPKVALKELRHFALENGIPL